MLVLSRKPRQTIHIGENIVVTVLWATANRVALGIAAPSGISIVRDDIKRDTRNGHSGENSAGLLFKSSEHG